MDKKSLIGLGLIAGILGLWLYLSGPTPEQIARTKHLRDSVLLVQKNAEIIEAAKIALEQPSLENTISTLPQISDSVLHAEESNQYRDFAISRKGEKIFYS